MNNKPVPQINVDEVMKKIREELSRRKAEALRTDAAKIRKTRIWMLVKWLQQNLKKFPFYRLLYGVALRFKKFIPEQKEYLLLEDFLKYDDEAFITHAYAHILKRTPDDEGFNLYVSRLTTHTFNKIQILGALRYSNEGRGKGVVVKGLFPRYLVNTIYRVPVLGYMVRLVTAVVQLPRIVRNVEQYGAYTARMVKQFDENITHLDTRLSDKADVHSLNKVRDDLTARLETKAEAVTVEPSVLNPLYVAFENRFRGTREDIKERLKVYLPYVEMIKHGRDAVTLLDAGCGRGEWLELMKEQGNTARGVDCNRLMVQQCTDQGFSAIEADAVEYLKKQAPGSLDIITGFHIVEHLPFKTVLDLFDTCLRALKPGGMIIVETPNPENLIVGACNFYTDPTHLHPLPPDTLQFLAEQRGFANIELLRLHTMREPGHPAGKSADNDIVQRMNMEQDYALIGYK